MKISHKLRTWLAAALLLPAPYALAADVVTVTGESTYYDDGTHSKVECMRLAAQEARVDALARKFGTIVSQDIIQTDRISGNREHNDFLNLSTTEVRGEWLADLGDPEYDISADKEGNYIVKCKVKGNASAFSNESAAFETFVLRNTPSRQAADNHFRDGDSMYLYFNGSVTGYINAFLQDEGGNVYQLLPYTTSENSLVSVRRNQEYFFFSPSHVKRDDQGAVDEFILTAPDRAEYNRLYVIYSPEAFSPPVMTASGAGMPVMKSADFARWLSKARRNDNRMGVKALNLEIIPKD